MPPKSCPRRVSTAAANQQQRELQNALGLATFQGPASKGRDRTVIPGEECAGVKHAGTQGI